MDATKKSREESFTKRLEAFKLKMKRLYDSTVSLFCNSHGVCPYWCSTTTVSSCARQIVHDHTLHRVECTECTAVD